MCLGVAGLLAQGKTTVHGAEAATVSYPDFWHHLVRLASPEGSDRDRASEGALTE